MIICTLAYLLILFVTPSAALAGSKYGASLWLTELLPTLLPFFIGIRMFQQSLPQIASRRGALLLGLLCGYPTGAAFVVYQYQRGLLPKHQAYFFLGFANNESYVYFILLRLLHTPFVLCRQCFPIPHNRADKSAWKPDFFFLIQKTLWPCMRCAVLFFPVYHRQNGNIQPVHRRRHRAEFSPNHKNWRICYPLLHHWTNRRAIRIPPIRLRHYRTRGAGNNEWYFLSETGAFEPFNKRNPDRHAAMLWRTFCSRTNQ